MSLKTVVNKLLPQAVSDSIRRYRHAYRERKQRGMTLQQIFDEIYDQGAWGRQGFYSGIGSHQPSVVQPYLSSVGEWLSTFPSLPTIVDLGCGDFNVGQSLVPLARQYTAIDLVPSLIERNKRQFAHLPVEFLCLDISTHNLPDADVCLVRQVLQHLSNADIERVIRKLLKYPHWIVSEHQPSRLPFVPNLDKPAGPDIRVALRSGVCLDEPPFNFHGYRQNLLLEVTEREGTVRTFHYSRDAP